jgi:hypothetical protein
LILLFDCFDCFDPDLVSIGSSHSMLQPCSRRGRTHLIVARAFLLDQTLTVARVLLTTAIFVLIRAQRGAILFLFAAVFVVELCSQFSSAFGQRVSVKIAQQIYKLRLAAQ